MLCGMAIIHSVVEIAVYNRNNDNLNLKGTVRKEAASIVEQFQHLLKCWFSCIDLFNTLQKYIYVQNSRCLLLF